MLDNVRVACPGFSYSDHGDRYPSRFKCCAQVASREKLHGYECPCVEIHGDVGFGWTPSEDVGVWLLALARVGIRVVIQACEDSGEGDTWHFFAGPYGEGGTWSCGESPLEALVDVAHAALVAMGAKMPEVE